MDVFRIYACPGNGHWERVKQLTIALLDELPRGMVSVELVESSTYPDSDCVFVCMRLLSHTALKRAQAMSSKFCLRLESGVPYFLDYSEDQERGGFVKALMNYTPNETKTFTFITTR